MAIPLSVALHFGLGGATGLSVAPAWEKQGLITDATRGALAGVIAEALWHRAGFSPEKWEYNNKHLAGSALGGALGGTIFNQMLRPPQKERNMDIVLPTGEERSPVLRELSRMRQMTDKSVGLFD